ncbi:MAG: hypothetical protein HYU66_14685 [Armatimonadetes bacterium]|nr:hypothetical protein [Armatimonadota bacterium]
MSDPAWYAPITPADARLHQGEILECPAAIPFGPQSAEPNLFFDETLELGVRLEVGLRVVMTQDCDIEHNNTATILLCRCLDLDGSYRAAWAAASLQENKSDSAKRWQEHRARLVTIDRKNLMLLDPFPPPGGANLVVDLFELCLLPRPWVEPFAQCQAARWRLAHPYLARLQEKFAHLYGRVGTPDATLC